MNKLNSKKGFTIIEVVLVLAIAGLIFLMVFVALPRLQISQRDTQRRDDVAAVATALTQYQTNNGGSLPGTSEADIKSFINNYLAIGGSSFNQPSSDTQYNLIIKDYSGTADTSIAAQSSETGVNEETGESTTTTPIAGTTIVVVKGVVCGADGALTAAGGRSYAIGMQLEGAGYYCTNN